MPAGPGQPAAGAGKTRAGPEPDRPGHQGGTPAPPAAPKAEGKPGLTHRRASSPEPVGPPDVRGGTGGTLRPPPAAPNPARAHAAAVRGPLPVAPARQMPDPSALPLDSGSAVPGTSEALLCLESPAPAPAPPGLPSVPSPRDKASPGGIALFQVKSIVIPSRGTQRGSEVSSPFSHFELGPLGKKHTPHSQTPTPATQAF